MSDEFNEIIVDSDFDNQIKKTYTDKSVNVPNTLLKSGKKSNLLDAKIDLLSNYKLVTEPVTVSKKDVSGNDYEVSATIMTMKEINELFPRKGNSLYSEIAKLQIAMQKRIFIYRDPESKKFQVKPLYLDITYDNGKLMIQYNPDTMGVFLDVTHGYTRIPLDIAFSLTTNGGFQLYKILREFTYKLPDVDLAKPQEEQDWIEEKFDYDGFRLQMGVVDLNNKDLDEELSKKTPNFENINKLENKAKYKRWIDFYNCLLSVGIKEINLKTDIYISTQDSEDIRISGPHNKTQAVRFKIMHNVEFYKKNKEAISNNVVEKNVKTSLSVDELDLLLDKLRDESPVKMSTSQLKSIAKAGDYNYEKINEAFGYVSDHLDSINNPVGACIDRLTHNYEPVKKNKTAKWAQMELSAYKDVDWNDLENSILNN